jgi:tetratricopeptide (TPR) repeat protein
VQSVILSRVDRLGAGQKQILQHAAVLGRLFRHRVLEKMGVGGPELEGFLRELEELGMVRRRPAPEREYSFKHVLTHETIYNTILRRRRTVLHARAAEILEGLAAGSPEGGYDELAQHYALGGRHAKAVEYLVKAGLRAKQLYANQEAIRYFEHARELFPRLAPAERDRCREAAVLEGLGDVLFRVGKHGEAERCFAGALELLPEEAPARQVADLTGKLADAVHWQGHVDRAAAVAEAGLAALGRDRTSVEGVKLLEVLMRSAWAVNDMESARCYGAELEAILPAVPYFDSLYMVYYALAWLGIKSRDRERAAAWLSAMEQVCAERGDENGLARCWHGRGDLCRMAVEYEEAVEWFRRSVELAVRTGDAHLLLEGNMEWGHLLLRLGRPETEVEGRLAKGMAIAEEMVGAGGVSSVQAMCNAIGRDYQERGDGGRAIRYFRQAIEYGPRPAPEEILSRLRELCEREGRLGEYEELCARAGVEGPGS